MTFLPLFPFPPSRLQRHPLSTSKMEVEREDLRSILPFLPLINRSSSSLFWPPKTLDSLKTLASGPDLSEVNSGESLFDYILLLRGSLGISHELLDWKASDGYSLFFDDLISRMDSRMWFRETVPRLANLMLHLPSLLEKHYHDSDVKFGKENGGLRLMRHQKSGIAFLSQELIASLLACALFCLFPADARGENDLPAINFDSLFAALHANARPSQEHKIKCLIHYFERISLCMPTGLVSFERKVLPFEKSHTHISYPGHRFWQISSVSLCPFQVFSSGMIEDQIHDALEVDFANKYLGGGTLGRGCVQEEIRFMTNPELIVGMLFMVSMEKNEAIEIVGAERFSLYMGYASSFRFVGDYVDNKSLDTTARRNTKIIAIDAISNPRIRQFEVKCLHRETNKAFCGFFDQSKLKCYLANIQEVTSKNCLHANDDEADDILHDACSKKCTSIQAENHYTQNHSEDISVNTGIATGNWGCGAFGGDPEIKCIIQWLAASQALRPFVHYYTFKEASLQRLEHVTQWILMHGWTVGDLWNMLVEYSTQRLNGQTRVGFLSWLVPDQVDTSDVEYMSE